MNNSTTEKFFSEQKEKSKIKTFIVTEFFKTYYSILSNCGKTKNGFIYMDLFSGPGTYDDGTESTPIVLLDTIDKLNKNILQEIEMIFNDENKSYYESLVTSIQNHRVYNEMKNKPVIHNLSAKDVDVKKYLCSGKPIFSFIDPWGYKDISANQIKDFVTAIGSDCILFFNVNRILQDLSKATSESHMRKIFGDEYDNAKKISKDSLLSQNKKSRAFVKAFSKNLYDKEFKNLKAKGYRLFVLPFEFKQDSTDKTSHFLLFISKNHKAILEMKRIMVAQSNSFGDELSYHGKNALNMCFFSRKDNLFINIENNIKKMFSAQPALLHKEETIAKWFELMDAYSMNQEYTVTPYTFNEFQTAIKQMDAKGFISVTSPVKRIRITQKATIKFNKEIMEN